MSSFKTYIRIVQVIMTLGLLLSTVNASELSRAFPQAGKLQYDGIKPSRYTQDELNEIVIAFYNYWKERYILESQNVSGDYKIVFNHLNETASEAMGYGMLIVVQMAGYDANAKGYFDGLNNFRKRYPSKMNNGLMSWKVNEVNHKTQSSATDGDIGIAMALLMAAEQWSDSVYKDEALVLLESIKKNLVRSDYSLKLGDWNREGGSHNGSRTSDYEAAHFRSFYLATGDDFWRVVEAKGYEILENIQGTYTSYSGLVPDFVEKDAEGKWHPVKGKFLESTSDGEFGYNTCRVPLRMGMSALYYGEERAKEILFQFGTWVANTHLNVQDFMAGYTLSGVPTSTENQPAFISPALVALMTTNYQTWLDNGFEYIKSFKSSYFSDTINILSLLVLSGNNWLPSDTRVVNKESESNQTPLPMQTGRVRSVIY